MKRSIVVLLALGLVVGSFVGSADAKKKKKKAPAPVATHLYAHGSEQLGNVEEMGTFPDPTYLKLDGTAPTETSSKHILFYDAGAGGSGTPNDNCGGNPLFPTFVGPLTGHVVGDMKFTFGAQSTPGNVEVRVWPDLNGQACNEAFVAPAAAATVALPSGQGTVTAEFKGVDFVAQSVIMVQITPILDAPKLGAVLYDSTADPTGLEMSCIPAAGAASCIPAG